MKSRGREILSTDLLVRGVDVLFYGGGVGFKVSTFFARIAMLPLTTFSAELLSTSSRREHCLRFSSSILYDKKSSNMRLR